MANSSSAKKRDRQARKRRLANRAQRSRMRTAIKRVMNASNAEEADAAFKETAAMLDRFASRDLIHPNKAARKKSQLARVVAALSS